MGSEKELVKFTSAPPPGTWGPARSVNIPKSQYLLWYSSTRLDGTYTPEPQSEYLVFLNTFFPR